MGKLGWDEQWGRTGFAWGMEAFTRQLAKLMRLNFYC
jgi:hypothetical protein